MFSGVAFPPDVRSNPNCHSPIVNRIAKGGARNGLLRFLFTVHRSLFHHRFHLLLEPKPNHLIRHIFNHHAAIFGEHGFVVVLEQVDPAYHPNA